MEVSTARKLFQPHPDTPSPFRIIHMGLIFAEVCSDCPDAEAVRRYLENKDPVGNNHSWVLRTRAVRGETYPKACDQFPDSHYHYIFTIKD